MALLTFAWPTAPSPPCIESPNRLQHRAASDPARRHVWRAPAAGTPAEIRWSKSAISELRQRRPPGESCEQPLATPRGSRSDHPTARCRTTPMVRLILARSRVR
jgi:hypothetical protein